MSGDDLPEDLELLAFDALDLGSTRSRHARLAELVRQHPHHEATLREIITAADLESGEPASSRRRIHAGWMLATVLAATLVIVAWPASLPACNPGTVPTPASVRDVSAFRAAQATLASRLQATPDDALEHDRIESQWIWLRAVRATYVDRTSANAGDDAGIPATEIRLRIEEFARLESLPFHLALFERCADQDREALLRRVETTIDRLTRSPVAGSPLSARLARIHEALATDDTSRADREFAAGWDAVMQDCRDFDPN